MRVLAYLAFAAGILACGVGAVALMASGPW